MTDPRQLLRSRLDQAFEMQWDARRPTKVEIVEGDHLVGLRLLAMDRSGAWHIVHEEPPVSLDDTDDVEELLARSLSVFLMEHPRWPK